MASLYPLDRPVRPDVIKKTLEYKMPNNLNNKKKLIWEKKINNLQVAYEYYVTNAFYDEVRNCGKVSVLLYFDLTPSLNTGASRWREDKAHGV